MLAATTGGERDEMGTTGVLRRKLKRQDDGRVETIDAAAAAAAAAVEPGGTKVSFRSSSISLSALRGALVLVVEDPMVLGYITAQFSSLDFFLCSSTAKELIVVLLLS
jgi:hypothetical protein